MIILTGPVHSGKTSLLKRIDGELMERGILVQGFLSESVWEKDQPIGYDLYNLQNKKSLPFIRKAGEEGWEKIGAYFFLPSGLAEAKRIISSRSPSKWLIVDEIGPLEISDKGLWPAIKHTLAVPSPRILYVVRTQILDNFLARIEHPDIHVYDVRMENIFSLILEKLTSFDK
jgi:nucleoside-triphosphatase THEP1